MFDNSSLYRSGWMDRYVIHAETARNAEFDLEALARAERQTSLLLRIGQWLGLVAPRRPGPDVRKAHAVLPNYPNALDDLGLRPVDMLDLTVFSESERHGDANSATPTVANLNHRRRVA